MSESVLALLEILDGYCFKRALCIDIDVEIENALNIRCEEVLAFQSNKSDFFSQIKNEKFDLIISFSDKKSLIQNLSHIYFEKDCEILIISENLISYNFTNFKKNILDRRLRSYLIYQIKKSFEGFSIQNYYPFPNVQRPEMILSKKGFSDYFRYWSWKKLSKGLVSKILEIFFVSTLRSPMFSPYIIIKLKNKRA